jgi:hypothetical protein
MTLLIQNLLTDEFHNLEDMDDDITVEDLKCLIEVASGVEVAD